MGSVDKATQELKKLLEHMQTHKDLHKREWYAPKQQMTQTELTYVSYVLPTLVVVSFVFFICMVLIVKREKTINNYIFLICQALFELTGILFQMIPFWVVFISSEQNDYIPFKYCEVVSKTKIVLCIVTVSCLSFPIILVTQIDYKFLKDYEKNTKTGDIEFYCRIIPNQIFGKYTNLIKFIVKDSLPVAIYIGFVAGMSYQIKKRNAERQQLQNNQNTDTSLDNLTKAIYFSSVVFIITSLPIFVLDLILVLTGYCPVFSI